MVRVRPLALGGVALAATAIAAPPPLAFREVTAGSGIAYAGPSWSVAWGDANGDAVPDLYAGNHGEPHNLFFGQGDGRFVEAPTSVFPYEDSDAHGAAWADYDNDGDQDLLELVGTDGSPAAKANRLFVNESGTFRDRAATCGLDDAYGRGRHAIWFDWDKDGRLDVLALNAVRAEAPSVLFRNNQGYFDRTSALAPLGFTKYPLLGSFTSGRLNLLLSGQPFPYRVFDANQVSALPLADQRSALRIPPQYAQTFDAALFDLNGDGRDDIVEVKGVMASDATLRNGQLLAHVQLDANGGTRGFDFGASGAVEFMIAPRSVQKWNPGVVYIGATGRHPVGIPFVLSPGDASVDGLAKPSGDHGVYVGFDRAAATWRVRVVGTVYIDANFAVTATGIGQLRTVGFTQFAAMSRPTLLLSDGTRYVDASAAAGFADAPASNCYSASAADFDNDGDVDLLAACSGPLSRQGVRNQLFRNVEGRFTAVTSAGGVARTEAGVADGVATADFDIDGFVDVVLTNGQGLWPFSVGPTQVFRNVSATAGNRNHWLEIDLRGVQSNRDGVGTSMVLSAGGRKQTRMQRNGVHNGAQDFQRVHFGVGAATRIDAIEVRWPSGVRQTVYDLPVDQVVRIVEGKPWSVPYTLLPDTQVFGTLPLYTTVSRQFTLANVSGAPVGIAKVKTVGVDAAQFLAASRCGSTLAAGASCLIDVTFKPTRTGSKVARLMVVAGDREVRLAQLAGTGT
ncbi:MAG TPA: FG-GAP-like repeat-containing protein [Steroidobacteraceae bacterium]|nr:FG-GAP-like repeat-containing protein [Steroidobacteraceae bacterium]